MKTTKLLIREDKPTSISSTSFKANLNGIAFNMDYISDKSPQLADKIIHIYEIASKR